MSGCNQRDPNQVWSYDFVHCRTNGGKTFRVLYILDEHTRECLASRVRRKLNSTDVIDLLTDLLILGGPPAYIRSGDEPEFVVQAVRNWINAVAAKTAYIKPGSPWENGYCESFNARLRDQLLGGENFCSLKEAQIPIEQWRKQYNFNRPHSALRYRQPAPETIVPLDQHPITHQQSIRTTQVGLIRSVILIWCYTKTTAFGEYLAAKE